MFAKATANFIRHVDPEGSFIHVSRVNDSDKLVPMALVVKRNRRWFWQRPKYHPTDFKLGDLLHGNKVLSPGVIEKEFLQNYEGIFGDKFSGKVDTKGVSLEIALEGQASSKLQSCFGKLKKEEMNVIKLLHDSDNRSVDMRHVLVRQLKKRDEVLAVVKERILTTNSCSVTLTRKDQCGIRGVLALIDMLGSSVKVCVNDSNSIEADSDVSLEIPSGTVIAYSVLELEIRKNGQFVLCLQPSTTGGIESDSYERSWPYYNSLNTVDGRCHGELVPLGALLNGSEEMDLSPLCELPKSVRCALFKEFQEILRNRNALSCLQCVLEDLCCSESPDVTEHQEPSDSQRDLVSAVLERLSLEDSATSWNDQRGISAQLKAAHLLVSAMDELSDEVLSLLNESSPDFLEAFDTLMCRLRENGEPLPVRSLPALLQDNQAFQLAEQLISYTNVIMRRDDDRLWMETREAGHHIVVLYLTIHGLSLLCKELKE